MKSIVKTIIVIVLFGLLTASSAPAQEALGEAPLEAVAEPIGSAVTIPSPSKEPVLPPPPPSPPGAVSFTPVATVADGFVLGDEPSRGTYSYVNVAPTAGGRSSSNSRKVLVIPNTEIKTEDLATITQDLQVMAHIFHKIFTGPRLIDGIFEDYGDFFGRGSRATEAVYLQGYGVLFLMEVNIPLSSPPKAKETEKDESTQKADSIWQQAKQEIFYSTTIQRTQPQEDKYDAEKVKELKSRLIKALKHAANIRNIKPEEWIILTVYGADQKGRGIVTYKVNTEGMSKPSSSNARGGYGGGYGFAGRATGGAGFGVGAMVGPGQKQASQGSVMTIHAKKADVDAFAKDELDFDKFREKVQIFIY